MSNKIENRGSLNLGAGRAEGYSFKKKWGNGLIFMVCWLRGKKTALLDFSDLPCFYKFYPWGMF